MSNYENTIVVFTSDNGPAFFHPPYMLEEGEPTDNAGLRGSKGWVHESGIRVPMVLRWLGTIEAGQSRDELAHFVDWIPTLLSLAGVSWPTGPPLDGQDLAPVLLGRSFDVEPRRYWQWNFYWPDVGTNAALGDGNWKLVRPLIRGTRFFSTDFHGIIRA